MSDAGAAAAAGQTARSLQISAPVLMPQGNFISNCSAVKPYPSPSEKQCQDGWSFKLYSMYNHVQSRNSLFNFIKYFSTLYPVYTVRFSKFLLTDDATRKI